MQHPVGTFHMKLSYQFNCVSRHMIGNNLIRKIYFFQIEVKSTILEVILSNNELIFYGVENLVISLFTTFLERVVFTLSTLLE